MAVSMVKRSVERGKTTTLSIVTCHSVGHSGTGIRRAGRGGLYSFILHLSSLSSSHNFLFYISLSSRNNTAIRTGLEGTMSSKYSTLPDIDTQPDVYETTDETAERGSGVQGMDSQVNNSTGQQTIGVFWSPELKFNCFYGVMAPCEWVSF
ncbi:hypothetical protein BC939DRAFT_219762 [Gamsiella multidivaricata]|uniref:uncharacterized protein n=1 Tax=Gamsiella multidivaricata TaxID=101098 RepID=UPI00221E923E|nr:uncharacterized protein BC939DRAFT_219762 [Gamsiella multidivaricata]KAI7831102.1 hypothetical protein BC939DRAFT_219762 [Gamsiella multidivaricata]